jgi:hypothetical protein
MILNNYISSRVGINDSTSRESLRVLVVSVSAFAYSFCGVFSSLPGLGLYINYAGIVVGFVFVSIYLLINFNAVRLQRADITFYVLLICGFLYTLTTSQDLLDILGNFIRVSFLLFAVIFWRVSTFDIKKLIDQLYDAFFRVSIIITLLILIIRCMNIPISGAIHLPVILFLFPFALYKRRYAHLLLIIAMSIISAKQALLFAIVAQFIFYISRNYLLKTAVLLYLFTLILFFFPLDQYLIFLDSLGGTFSRLSDFLMQYFSGVTDTDILNKLSSNRYLEYQSVFQDWSDYGIPFLGRGLGATVSVQLGWLGYSVSRSTLHNSFLVVFQTSGLIGIVFLLYYIFLPVWRTRKYLNELFVVLIGILVYSFFSNTLFQAPSIVFTLALAKNLSELHNSKNKKTKQHQE